MPISRADAARLDDASPLAGTRDRFVLPPGVVNLDGNSLGSPPRTVAERLERVVTEEWTHGLIRSWEARWWDLPLVVGDRIGRLVGASPGQIAVGDSTSVCLYRAVRAAVDLNAGRDRIVYDADDFPTDRYLVEQVAEGYDGRVEAVPRTHLVDAVDADTAVVVVSHVDYRTADLLDMAAVTAACHARGALVLWDLSHSAGALPVWLDDAGVDLAVGCTYKYLNGGPGSPAFTYVARRHHDQVVNAIPGWVGHADPFAMEPTYRPGAGIRRMLTGTPSVLSLSALDAALDAYEGIDLGDVRRLSSSLTGLLIDLVDERLGWEVVTPRDPARRGSHVSVRHPDAAGMVTALAAVGVIADARTVGSGRPDLLRLGLAPLYVRHVDVWDAVGTMAALATGSGAPAHQT